MNPSERIKHIKEISKELSKEDWTLLDLTLKQFNLPWSDQWGGNKESYIVEMLADADDAPLLDLAKHLGIASELENVSEPSFWSASDARIFLTHLAKHKAETNKIRMALAGFGITAFVAHEDIEPTKEWQAEIESALATMDGLVALLTPGFSESKWCDQEIGVAIGRRVPLVAVKQGLDPYGFIGKYQAFQGTGKSAKEIANGVFELLLPLPGIGGKITTALVSRLENAGSFQESKRIVALIEQSPSLTSKHTAAMKEAIKNNDQVSSSWGVPEKINRIAEKIES